MSTKVIRCNKSNANCGPTGTRRTRQHPFRTPYPSVSHNLAFFQKKEKEVVFSQPRFY